MEENRDQLKSVEGSYVPILSLHLKSLSSTNEKDPKETKTTKEKEREKGGGEMELVHVQKVISLAKQINGIVQASSSSSSSSSLSLSSSSSKTSPDLQSNLINCPYFEEEELFQLSNEREPSDVEAVVQGFVESEERFTKALSEKDQQISELKNTIDGLTKQVEQFQIQLSDSKKERKNNEAKFIESTHDRDLIIEKLTKKIYLLEGPLITDGHPLLPATRNFNDLGFDCSRCSSSDAVSRCLNCGDPFCVPCQRFKSIKNPCPASASSHRFAVEESTSSALETKSGTKKTVKSPPVKSTTTTTGIRSPVIAIPGIASLLSPPRNSRTTSPRGQNEFSPSEEDLLTKKRFCERCGAQSEKVRDCHKCSQAFCENCQQLKGFKTNVRMHWTMFMKNKLVAISVLELLNHSPNV